MLQTSSCDRKLSSHHNVILRAEQTSFSRFLFPLSLIFFLQRLFKSCCQNYLPLLLFWWHHPYPWLAPVFSFRVPVCLHFLGLHFCAASTAFSRAVCCFSPLLHGTVVLDVPALWYLFIFTSNKRSIPRSLPKELHLYIYCSSTY